MEQNYRICEFSRRFYINFFSREQWQELEKVLIFGWVGLKWQAGATKAAEECNASSSGSWVSSQSVMPTTSAAGDRLGRAGHQHPLPTFGFQANCFHGADYWKLSCLQCFKCLIPITLTSVFNLQSCNRRKDRNIHI